MVVKIRCPYCGKKINYVMRYENRRIAKKKRNEQKEIIQGIVSAYGRRNTCKLLHK